MITAALARPNCLDAWREAARPFLERRTDPGQIYWSLDGENALDMFDDAAREPRSEGGPPEPVRLPKAFYAHAERAICHRSDERFSRLYRIAYRLLNDKRLLEKTADEDMVWLRKTEKSVSRDIHKMKAFVRFRRVAGEGECERYIAWFEPDHLITERAAPFFMRRFTGMRWAILTPDRSVSWNGETLTFGAGAEKSDAPDDDALEEAWRIYFQSIFNPARVKVKAMTAEMPKKYWKNLPEAPLIPALVATASARAETMVKESVTNAHPLTDKRRAAAKRAGAREEQEQAFQDLESLHEASRRCARCRLCETATQTVVGEGPAQASVVFVGEQPGDLEDLNGRPFIGPAGELLRTALRELNIAEESVYLTNAVKHFKFRVSQKRRLHQTPSAEEIDICRWWLDHEIALIKPSVIVALGASALRGLTGRTMRVAQARRTDLPHRSNARIVATYHPAYILRSQARPLASETFKEFKIDIARAAASVHA